MVTPPSRNVGERRDLDSLGLLAPEATGGAALIFRSATLPDRVFKQYREPSAYESRTRELIHYRNQLAKKDFAYVRDTFAWPEAQVFDRDKFVGILMPRIPAAFTARLTTGRRRERNLSYLIYSDRARQVGIAPPPPETKLRVIASLARACDFLEHLGLIHEDLSPLNIQWRADGTAGIYLLDCDSIRTPEEAPSPPAFLTPDWVDARVLDGAIPRPDRDSTSYTLGLILARTIMSPSWRPPLEADQNPSEKDPLNRLILRSVGPSLPRPSMADWVSTLEQSAEKASSATSTSPPANVTIANHEAAQRVAADIQFDRLPYQVKDRIAVGAGILLGIIGAVLTLLLLSRS